MGNFGMTEILIILFIVILLFGGKKIPELAKGIGEGVRSFKKGLKGDESEETKK
ncbi:MAG: twin-arginine translocase TatA/TatE family subunit [Ignavibacteriales bacterium]|nr:twin-arginine translocase TatA/TatE family subunit [Ignavibacteriales bacterium]